MPIAPEIGFVDYLRMVTGWWSSGGPAHPYGLEYTLPTNRLHHTLPDNRLHHTLPANRLHYTLPEHD